MKIKKNKKEKLSEIKTKAKQIEAKKDSGSKIRAAIYRIINSLSPKQSRTHGQNRIFHK